MKGREKFASVAHGIFIGILLAEIYILRVPKPTYPWADYDLWAPELLIALAFGAWALEDWMLRRWGAGLILKIMGAIFYGAISVPILVMVISG